MRHLAGDPETSPGSRAWRVQDKCVGRTAEPRAACRGSRACVPAPPPPAPGCMGSQELGDTGGELSPLPAKCAAASVPSGVSRRRPRCPHPSAPRAASDACGQRWFVSPASGCRVAPGTSSQAAPGGRAAWGAGGHSPAGRARVLAEVRARLAGGQLQQLRPLALPLLLRVHQP